MNLRIFKEQSLFEAMQSFFRELKVPMNYVAEEPTTAKEILKDTYKENSTFKLIEDVYFVGMVDDAAFEGNKSLAVDKIKSDYDGVLVFGLTLHPRENNLLPTRSQLAEISRAFNREYYYTPVVLVFKYSDKKSQYIAFANTQRLQYKQAWREGEKAGKVSLLRDIDIQRPHRGHEDILNQLRIQTSGTKAVDSFAKLYAYWQEVFSVSVLNKRFYQELSNWYFWAVKQVTFPSKPTEADAITKKAKLEDLIQEHNATNVIRLLTRLLFTWFIKEKKLIPEELFDLEALQKNILNEIAPYHENGLFNQANKDSVYYKAILQNLFFASLNCPIKSDGSDTRERGFRGDGYGTHRGIDYLMRYKRYYKNPAAFLELMNGTVPFLNGGLFECLDDKYSNTYFDGFSDQMTKGEQLIVPDYLFFGVEEKVDLSVEYGVNNASNKNAAVKGLINILKSYKFTITENTPIEEDVALDPELLGKVFENLLASYNPETKTTARKQTGSFYTPREIVNYMVDESLITYLKNSVSDWEMDENQIDEKLHELASFDLRNPFENNTQLTRDIIYALDRCKILDPACGSGAFPMGALQKMVHILQKLDPENIVWKEIQLQKVQEETNEVFKTIDDKGEREEKLKEINNAFDQRVNDPDYARKLYLVENCIYGVDIQPIATQISKLRFFISLVVDQKSNDKQAENFGIRPLPNLETKFVAANTLIGIDKEANLFTTDKVKNLEKQLKHIRHKLFSARTKDTKIKYRQKDEELRTAIADELKNQGLPIDSAEKLAKWDPYDQNASSPFFDSEWMFDISEGFDVVIGNPPYKILTKNNTDERELNSYLKKFESIRKSSSKNLYTLFIEKGVYFTKNDANLSYIVPEGLFTTRSYSGCVEVMEKYGSATQIITFSDFVFENAVTGNVIFLYRKKQYLSSKLFHFDKNYLLGEKVENKKLEITEIRRETLPLKDVSITFKGMVVKDRNEVLSSEKGKDVFLLGKNISKWRINSCLYTDYDNLIIIGGTKKLSKHNVSPRILIRRTGNTLCCAYLKRPALTESTLYSTWSTNSKYTNLFLFGVLNSKLLDHFNRTENITNQQGFPQILMTDLELLPIKEPNPEFTKTIEVLAVILNDLESHVIESTLNAIVFNLYFPDHMKEREIDVLHFVAQDIEKVMQGRDFEKLSDTEKERVIEQLHAIWTNPNNEVVKRMAMFKEKSPEILKPILES